MLQKNNLLGLTREELQDYLISLNEKPYRGLQIFEWIHNKGVIDFDSMTNLGKDKLLASLHRQVVPCSVLFVQQAIMDLKET